MSMYIDNLDDMEDLDEECPLCMEPLEIDDLNFYPCTCGYQICRFCWHRIRTDENGLCPACRKAYSENPADFKPLSNEELQKIKRERKATEASRRQKLTESRKHLASVRVVQKNLVFVVGLGPRLADTDVLRKNEYFGKFGKIHKVVVNHTTTYAGSQGPSASAYITYFKEDDSLRAIQAVNNLYVDGRTLKASLGTTKYCSSFLNSPQCPKPVTCPRADCMYLHELGDEEASFTKEEMQLGRHTEFEQRLHEALNRSEMTTTTTTNNNAVSSTASSIVSSSGFPTSAPVSTIPPPASNETPIPLMASSAGSSASSSLGNASSNTIVSLMGLDLSKTIQSARKKTSSQSPPPPPPAVTSLMMDSRGVIKPSGKTADAPPGVEWPALGGSRGVGGFGESEYPPLSREHSTSMDVGPSSDSFSSASTTITTTTTMTTATSATTSEVLSFSTIVNGDGPVTVSGGGGGAGVEVRRKGEARDGDGSEVTASAALPSKTGRTMTMMEIGAGDGFDVVSIESTEAAVEEVVASAAAGSKKAKKKARKDGSGNPGEESTSGLTQDVSGKAGNKATNVAGGNGSKKQQQPVKDAAPGEKKGNGNNATKAQNVKGDKANKKKLKEEAAAKKNGANGNKSNDAKEKSAEGTAAATAALAEASEMGGAGDAKKSSKPITSLDPTESKEETASVDPSHLPPSPSPSPPFSTPSSSQSSSLSSTPSSSNSLSTAPKDVPRLSSVALGNAEAHPVAGHPFHSADDADSQALPTPTASPDSALDPLSAGLLPRADRFPSSSSSACTFSALTKGINSSTSLPLRIEDENPNSSFFSNEFTRIRFVPTETSDVMGVARMATDVEYSTKSGADSKSLSHIPPETDWSAAFGFNSAKEPTKSSMEAEPDVEEDEDLGFDPFCESQRGLEDLLRGESTGQDFADPFPGFGRMNTRHHLPGDAALHKLPGSSQFPPSLHHPSFLIQSKAQPFPQQHPGLTPTQKSQSSLLDGLIQQHHDSLEDLLPRSSDAMKKTTSPSHPPGFFSSNPPTSSRFFGSNNASEASSHAATLNLGAQKNQQAESFLRSLLFDNPSTNTTIAGDGRNPMEALPSIRTTPPTGIPPPPPGMGLPQQQQQQPMPPKPVSSMPFASNASQRLPPGFSSDNLTRQHSDLSGNALDDFLGRSGWSKMQQPSNRGQQQPPLDNQGFSQLQHYPQQSNQRHPQHPQQQNYSKMMGLMNLGGASGKNDDLEGSTPFPPPSSSTGTALNAGSGGTSFPKSGFPFGSSSQPAASASTSVKDWQEGFRALLPNVNISFGQNANQSFSGTSSGSSGFSNNMPPWDDPAIVTAANASKHFNNNNNSPLRSNQEARGNQDEQPHWMKSLQQLTEMTDSAPPKQTQGSSPSAFLPTLAGVNQSSLLGGPFSVNSAQQQQHHHQQQHHMMHNAMMGGRGQSERLFQMGGNGADWAQSYSSGFSGPSLTSAPPGFRLPNATSGQAAPAGATN